MSGRIRVGTSGYVYRDWKELFYEGVPARAWLERYAREFDTVELNGTFYRLPPPGSAERWRSSVPDGFAFAAKGGRFLTHLKRLQEPEKGLARYYERVDPLGSALEVVLWQLPPQMAKPDLPRLDAFLAAQPPGRRHAVEFRSAAAGAEGTARC